MTQSEIPLEKIEAYRGTEYRFGTGSDAGTLRIDQRSEVLARLYTRCGHTCALFITAWNPFGQEQSIEANEFAHQALRDELRSSSTVVIEGAGVDPSGAWPAEKSYLALGVDLADARRLGRRYRQDAVVWAGADAVPVLVLLR